MLDEAVLVLEPMNGYNLELLQVHLVDGPLDLLCLLRRNCVECLLVLSLVLIEFPSFFLALLLAVAAHLFVVPQFLIVHEEVHRLLNKLVGLHVEVV